MDQIHPPLEAVSAVNIYEIAEGMGVGTQIRVQIKGEDLEGRLIDKTVMLPIGEAGTGQDRLMEAGLELLFEDDKAFVDNVVFGSTAERQKIDFDFEIASVQVKSDRPPRQLFYIPALALLAFIVMIQLRRSRKEESDPVAA